MGGFKSSLQCFKTISSIKVRITFLAIWILASRLLLSNREATNDSMALSILSTQVEMVVSVRGDIFISFSPSCIAVVSLAKLAFV